MNPNLKNVLAVFAGLASITVTGLALYPLLSLIFEKHFHIFESSTRTEDVIIISSSILFVLIPCFIGGWVTTLLASNRHLFMALVTGIATVLILFIFEYGTNERHVEWDVALYSLIPFVFCTLGGWVAYRLYRKKKV